MMLVDHVLEAMIAAGVEHVVIPITPEKAASVMRYLGTRLPNGALISYIAAPGPTLVANVAACADLLQGKDVLFGMPDTVFAPREILRRCRDRLLPGARPARPRSRPTARSRGRAGVQLTATTSLNE